MTITLFCCPVRRHQSYLHMLSTWFFAVAPRAALSIALLSRPAACLEMRPQQQPREPASTTAMPAAAFKNLAFVALFLRTPNKSQTVLLQWYLSTTTTKPDAAKRKHFATPYQSSATFQHCSCCIFLRLLFNSRFLSCDLSKAGTIKILLHDSIVSINCTIRENEGENFSLLASFWKKPFWAAKFLGNW